MNKKMSSRRMGDVSVEVVLHNRAQHPEGPIWDEATARLWWVDIAAKQVHCFDPASGGDQSWALAGEPGGVVIDSAGVPLVATPEGLAVLDRATGSVELYVPIERDKPENRANDAKVDSRGRVWIGTMPYDKRPRHAALYRVDGDDVTRIVDGLTISNGPAFDEAGGRLYLADTALGIVDVFDLDVDSGRVSGRRRFLDFRDAGWWPDGMTIDDEGMLWVALGRAGAVHRYSSDGVFCGGVSVPTSNPTSVAFGGVNGRDLYITTSWTDLDMEERLEQSLAGAIFRCRPGVIGRASPRYARGGERGKDMMKLRDIRYRRTG
jgi:sugar lactone lactonase YvrE